MAFSECLNFIRGQNLGPFLEIKEFQMSQEEIFFFFRCFSLLPVLIRNFLFIKNSPVLLVFNKNPPTLLFGTLVIFRNQDYIKNQSYKNIICEMFLCNIIWYLDRLISWIQTKMANLIKSLFINRASHKHFNYTFVNKSSYVFL